jgi:hypothetical protein
MSFFQRKKKTKEEVASETRDMSVEEKREYELNNMIPDKISEYTGEAPALSNRNPLNANTIHVYLPADTLEHVAPYVKKTSMGVQFLTRPQILSEVCRLMSKGLLHYDEESKRLKICR